MARGRRAQAPELKELKGNPGKRRLKLDAAAAQGSVAAKPKGFAPNAPEYLTQDSERAFFKMAIDTLPANIARASDVHAIARWAAWLSTWVECKLGLEKTPAYYESTSAHGTFLREHPMARRIDRVEHHLLALEDRIGLNVVARNNIVHRLFAMPTSVPLGGLFGDEPPVDDKHEPLSPVKDQSIPAADPLGFLQHAGKPH